jgi:hypothetical protein
MDRNRVQAHPEQTRKSTQALVLREALLPPKVPKHELPAHAARALNTMPLAGMQLRGATFARRAPDHRLPVVNAA